MKNNVLFLFVAVVLCSCPRSYPTEALGEPITPAPDGFSVENNSFTSSGDYDFTTGSLSLNAVFNSTVTANVNFSGLESGATRNMTVITDRLNASTLSWYGEMDPGTTNFFETGEQVVIRLSFYNTDVILYDTITITQANDFTRSPNVIPVALEADNGFEETTAWPWWAKLGNFREVLNDNTPEGDYCIELYGSSPSSVWVSGASYGHRGLGPYKYPAVNGAFYPFSNDPSNLWFNIYVFGDESDEAEFYVSFLEADESLGNNSAEKGIDDAVQVKVETNHIGWKLFSYQYSMIPFQGYCVEGSEGGGCGDKIKEPHRIKMVEFALQTENRGQEVSVKFDYPFFTIGAPFDPVTFSH